MTKQQTKPHQRSAYERIGLRIQKLIADPKVQKRQSVVVRRLDEEPLDEWDRLIEDLQSTDGVTVIANEDGTLNVGWKAYSDA